MDPKDFPSYYRMPSPVPAMRHRMYLKAFLPSIRNRRHGRR